MKETKDSELVKQCLRGKLEAFEELVDRYQKPIFNCAYRMTNNYDDAEDITQSVFIKAYEKLKMYRTKYKFFSWIYRIAVNETLNYLNQKKRVETLDPNLISEEKTPEELYDTMEMNKKLQNALMDIGLDYQILIVLKHFQNFSYREIAYILDIPENKVKSRLFSARQMLRGVLISKGFVFND